MELTCVVAVLECCSLCGIVTEQLHKQEKQPNATLQSEKNTIT